MIRQYRSDIKRLIAGYKKIKSIDLTGEEFLLLSLSMDKLMSEIEKDEQKEREEKNSVEIKPIEQEVKSKRRAGKVNAD